MSDIQDKSFEGIVPPTSKSETNSIGRFFNNTFNSVKSGFGKASKFISNSKIGKVGRWAWKNKAPILNTIGGATHAYGVITANPAAVGIGKGLNTIASGIKEGEAKTALQKAIAERQPNPLNSNVSYSDYPRIHYSRKPASYKIYQNHNNEEEAHIARLRKQKRKKSRKVKK